MPGTTRTCGRRHAVRNVLVAAAAVFTIFGPARAVITAGGRDRPVQSDQQILIQLERDWDAAFHRKDVRFIENILGAEFLATYADGSRADKAKELALAADFDQQIDSSTLDEFTVKGYGDTAAGWVTPHL